jgi:hypothetical protein
MVALRHGAGDRLELGQDAVSGSNPKMRKEAK